MSRVAPSRIATPTGRDLAAMRQRVGEDQAALAARTAALENAAALLAGAVAALPIGDLTARLGVIEAGKPGTDAAIAALAARATALENAAALLAQSATSQAAAHAALAGRVTSTESLLAVLPRFVSPNAMTVAQLLAGFPAGQHIGLYARVTDLFGELTTTMIAEGSAGTAYWRPTRQDFAKTLTIAQIGTAPTLYALTSPPTLRLTGNASGNTTMTLSPDGAWPGAKRTIVQSGTLGIYTFRIAGLALGAVLAMLTGTRATFEFDGSAWWQSA